MLPHSLSPCGLRSALLPGKTWTKRLGTEQVVPSGTNSSGTHLKRSGMKTEPSQPALKQGCDTVFPDPPLAPRS